MKRLLLPLLMVILVMVSVLAACGGTKTQTTSSIPATTTPTTSTVVPPQTTSTGNWWTELGEPQYGGTIVVRMAALADKFDPYFPWGAGAVHYYWYEHLLTWDWTLDRDVWPFKTAWATSDYFRGMLAESWEWPDPQTMVIKLRQGIYWQNKAPVNGREFTAEDVVYHYDRVFGTGNGFTTPNPVISMWGAAIVKAVAIDKYTVEVKFNTSSPFINASAITDTSPLNIIECPEAVKTDITDWKNSVGTGAWQLTDFMTGSSMTLVKNPNYWGHDERYPENKLPYADSFKLICIPDVQTAVSAMRTGKVEYIDSLAWQQADSLAKTNPDLKSSQTPQQGYALNMRCDTAPFTDINVRKALQMSVDRQSIADNYYGGTVDGTPVGLISTLYKGWHTPFAEWPVELQGEYTYNPEKARQLLADAGYPDGFKTNVIAGSADDSQLLQLIKAEFMDIGVDMEIKVMDSTAADAFIRAKKHDQMTAANWVAFPKPPQICLNDLRSTQARNSTQNNDSVYDGLVAKVSESKDIPAAQKAVIAADMYALSKHWGVVILPQNTYTVWAPYIKGYLGENIGWNQDLFWSRIWIDK